MLIIQENEDIPNVHFLRVSGKPTDEELDVYLEAERQRMQTMRTKQVAIVMELKDVWTSTQRRRMRDFELEMSRESVNKALGMAIVVPNAIIRGAFTAYFWLAAPEYPTKMVPSASDAYDFVAERLGSAGLTPPDRSRFQAAAQAYWEARQAVPGRGLVTVERGQVAGHLSA